ncbi:MAG: helix-turn-helix domain-containing protein [Sphingorhabdus sp.]
MHESHEDGGSFGPAHDGAADHFTDPEKLNIVQFAPPADLAPYVTQLYYFRCEERDIRDMQPAALGHIVFKLRGEGELHFADGRSAKIHPVILFGPASEAAEFRLKGPYHNFGLALSPLGFVALTGKAAHEYADRLIDAAEIFGSDIDRLALRLQDGARQGIMRPADMVRAISEFLLPRAKPVKPDHVAVILAVGNWLSSSLEPDVEDLLAELDDMSRSKVTRLMRHYFGAAPKPLMRKYRALRAASHLVDPETSRELRAQVESLFYDQPHMIREIRHFTGRTPKALDGDDAKILRMWLSKDNYRDLDAHPG